MSLTTSHMGTPSQSPTAAPSGLPMKAPAVSVQGAPAPTQSPTSSPTCAHAISGTVKTGDSLRLLNVLLTLHNSKECVVGLMTTGPAGTYEFTDLLPGCYMVKVTNPPGYNSNGKRKKPLTGFLQLSRLHCPLWRFQQFQCQLSVQLLHQLPATLGGYGALLRTGSYSTQEGGRRLPLS